MSKFKSIVTNSAVVGASSAVVGGGVGATITFFTMRRRYMKAIHILADELERISSQNIPLVDEEPFDPADFPGVREKPQIEQYVRDLGYLTLTEDVKSDDDEDVEGFEIVNGTGDVLAIVQDSEVVHHNIFDGLQDEWDYDVEKANRQSDKPYVIHVDEFVANESEYETQKTLTYYEADDILADDKDVPFTNIERSRVVGRNDLLFGHGSLDPNIVYMRNDALGCEYEIIRESGSYQEVVLGANLEEDYAKADLKHSRAPQRMRKFD